MTLHENTKSIVPSDNSAVIEQTAANDTNGHKDTNDHKDTDVTVSDNGINLATIFEPYFRPDENTIVCGALDDEKVVALAAAGVELVLNLQPDDELSFDERAAVERAGMHYEQLPISGTQDLKQLKILAFDNILRQYHGKKTAMHCGSGNRVGAAMALRAGWLRGRKMDTAMERGRSHGLTKLAEEVRNRLLVPR
ncbi:serine/threonine protein phosphatase [Psychrobacter sp.]|uniref:serine/threonine protein phosphatase n=1 Tax=Psychrobacter sp. TaxID=56811 RepID=UPI003BB03CC0